MNTASQSNIPGTNANVTASPVKAAHSPLPWFVNEYSGTEIGFNRDASGDEIVTAADLANTASNLDGDEDEVRANAAFIVRAVNNHAALVATLTAALCDRAGCFPEPEWMPIARAVLERSKL